MKADADYFYLEVELDAANVGRLAVRRAVDEAVRAVLGAGGAARLNVDVLAADRGRALLRLHGAALRAVCGGLALAAPAGGGSAPAAGGRGRAGAAALLALL